jgi:tagatose 6-phosphate kinase
VHLVTITLNGTLDRVLQIPRFHADAIWSSGDLLALAGGKGINTARAAAALDAKVLAVAVVAGQCGAWIGDLLKREGMPYTLIHLPRGESRISTIVVDTVRRQTTVINDEGPAAAPDAWPSMRERLVTSARGAPWVVLAGASLPGLPDTVYGDLCADLQGTGQRVLLDARDRWLAHALPARPALVKCNQHELARLVERPVERPEDALDAVGTWIAGGIHQAVITMGKEGAVAVDDEGAWHVTAPQIEAVYPIGSGDAMTGGLLVALERGLSFAEAVRYGVAVGTANTLLPGSGRCDLEALPGLLAQTHILPL